MLIYTVLRSTLELCLTLVWKMGVLQLSILLRAVQTGIGSGSTLGGIGWIFDFLCCVMKQ